MSHSPSRPTPKTDGLDACEHCKGPVFDSRQPNTELSNPPISESPPPNYQSIDTRHITPAQTQAYSPTPLRIPLASNTNIQSPNEGMLVTPPMSHPTPAAYPPGGPPLPSTVVPPTGDSGKEIIIAVMGVTGNTHEYSKPAVR